MNQNYSVLRAASAANKILAIVFAATFLFPYHTKAATWTYTLASPNPSVTASNLCPGDLKKAIYFFTIGVTSTSGNNGPATMSQLTFTTNAGYNAASVTRFQLWRNTVAAGTGLAGATWVQDITTSLGPASHSFPVFSVLINTLATYQFWITVDVAGTATGG